jgi:type VI protein secretion system component Hcp
VGGDDLILLQVDGIKGGSRITGYEEQLELASYRWEMGHEVGKPPVFQQLVVQKSAGISGPALWLHAATAKVIPKMVLSVIHTGGEKLLPYYVFELSGVTIRSFEETANEGERPVQVIGFAYQVIVSTLYTYSDRDEITGRYRAGWDVVNGKPR